MTIDPKRLLTLTMVLGLGFTFGRMGAPEETAARADIRRTPPRETFKSGSARSEELLVEISSTLKRLDARVGRIEAKLPKAQ